MNILEIKNLSVLYQNQEPAVNEVSLSVRNGEIVAVVGESGSGKSTLLRAVLGLLQTEGRMGGGRILFDGEDMSLLSREQLRRIRGKEISMIFQNAGEYLNPRRRIGSQYLETLRCHYPEDKKTLKKQALAMLETMRLPDPDRIMRSYPFQLSGGMKQRVAIAMAMSLKPRLLLADEPTSALDVTVQAQVIQEMLSMRKNMGTAIMLVTHNMGVAAYAADRIAVMQHGKLMEFGARDQVISAPESDYTKRLLAAVPELEGHAIG